MITGTGKPRLYLLNGAMEADIEISFDTHAAKIVPIIIPDLLKQRGLDLTFNAYNRGFRIDVDCYFPYVTDSEYRDFIDLYKQQFEFDEEEDDNQYKVAIMPRSDYDDVYYGWITTDLELINEFHFLTHGLKFKLEGSAKLANNAFLMSKAPSAPNTPLTTYKSSSSLVISWTAPTVAPDGYMVNMRATLRPDAGPTNGTVYAVSDTLGGGTIKKFGTGVTLTVSGLSSATTYHFRIYSYKGTNVYNVTYSSALSHYDTTS